MNGHQALREVVIVSAVGATPSLSLNTTAEHASRLIAISSIMPCHPSRRVLFFAVICLMDTNYYHWITLASLELVSLGCNRNELQSAHSMEH